MVGVIVPVADIDWEWVRRGIEITKRKVKTRWTVEDTFRALRDGTACLYQIADKGFCILQQQRDHDGLALFVWWLWCPGLAEIKDEFCAALDELARACNCVRIRGASPREGFGLVGYMTEVSRTFERELGNA